MNINQSLVREEDQEEDQPYKPTYIKFKIDLNCTTDRPGIKLDNKANGVRDLVAVENFKILLTI